MGKRLFITGTGTDVGKTYITGLIVKKLYENGINAGYFKAAMSGNDRREDGSLIPGDAVCVKNISGIKQPEEEMCPYVYENAWSPHLASMHEGNPVDLSVVKNCFNKVCDKYDFVTMEGSGGILCPIRFDNQRLFLPDLIKELGLSCLIIADAGLGTINNVVLTVEYMRAQKIGIKGLIFNHYHSNSIMENDNIKMCQLMTDLPVIATVEDNCKELTVDLEKLIALYE